MWLRTLLRLRGVLVGVIIGLGLAVLLIVWRNGDQHIIRKPIANNNKGELRDLEIWKGKVADVDTTLLTAPVQNQIVDEKPVTSQNKTTDTLEDETNPQSDLNKAYSHVKTILFFIGYPRSRHSLLGSLLDAHPHMVVSDETLAFSRWQAKKDYWAGSMYKYYNTMFKASERAVAKGRRSHLFNENVVNKSSAYAYYVPDQWQGTFDGYIEVIGDKAGAFTAGAMMTDNSIEAVHLLEKASGAKVKFVHVVRNPFDNIATQTLQHKEIKGRDGEHEIKQIDAPDILDEKMRQYFNWAEGSNKAREALPGSVIDIPSMEIVKHPAETLRKICAFLEITCTEDYIQGCAATVDPVPSITRNFVEWSEEQKKRVYEEMKRFSFFEGYSFDN